VRKPTCISNRFWLQVLQQNVTRQLPEPEGGPLGQPRYYDFNVWSYAKQTEKLLYIHRNPVTRGLVQSPEEWTWSSLRHYLSGADGVVEIESQWAAHRRERMRIELSVLGEGTQNSRPFDKLRVGLSHKTRHSRSANRRLRKHP
jgi:hypothetical protein